MGEQDSGLLEKLSWSLPWLARYPFWRAGEAARRAREGAGPLHLIVMVADHFEPSWSERGGLLPVDEQRRRLDRWCELARATGEAVRDVDGTPFRHTNFYPAEQYHRPLLETLAGLQAEGFGEVEVHLHHGVERPDTEANLRRALVEFRDTLAEEHGCLSREGDGGQPKYAFVHGNLALANSAGGRFCGVDNEMRVLAETGCYADFTLPAAPLRPQVPRLNAVYEPGRPLDEPVPHRSGPSLKVGRRPRLPAVFTGPLVFNWERRVRGLPVPRLDDGVLAANYPTDFRRLERWAGARVSVRGRPEWVFVKLYCHGFFTFDQSACIGEGARRFWSEALEESARSNRYRIHFASAREAFNIAMAAVDGRDGEPNQYRDYLLRPIMREPRGGSGARRGRAPAADLPTPAAEGTRAL
ncbi:MAG TPA: hypothetical protein VN228_08070 [Pyrinomonadaceae bacterium]|nr:hypothetical protein [Pyrinomonadaceae bacterium]